MNKDFISDDEMNKLENPDFISDEDMAKIESYDWSNAPKDLAKSMTEALPMVGSQVGEIVGMPFGPAAQAAAAGVGSMAGESLKNTAYGIADLVTGKRSLQDELRFPTQEELTSLLGSQANAFMSGAGGTMGGQLAGKAVQVAGGTINKGFQNLADAVQPPVKKANADDIIKAAKELGVDVTPGMLDDAGFLERLESSLSKSPSIFGRSVARDLQKVRTGLTDATESVIGKGIKYDPYTTGESFKSGITSEVHQRIDPISEVFQDVAESTKNIPINEKSLAAIQRNASNIDLMQMGIGTEKAQKYVDAIPKLKNANQVKTLMTMLNDDYATAQGAERRVLGAIKEKLQNLEKNSIMRSSIQAARDSGGAIRKSTGEKIGADIIGDLKDARRTYREVASGLQDVAKTSRLSKGRINPNEFMGAVEAIPSERIPQKFFNTQDVRQMEALKAQFPEQFELLRKAKLGEIAKDSIDNSVMGQGGTSTQKFLNEFRDLNPQAQSSIFGEDLNKISNIEKVQQSFPRNFNPSGTASERSFQDALYSNVKDIPNYLLYKGASSSMGQKVSNALLKSPQMLELSKSNPKLFESFISRMSQGFLEKNNDNSEQQEQKPFYDKNNIIEKTKGSKYSQVLENAAQKGDQSFNAAHFVLSNNNKEYRQLLEDQEQ